MKISDWGIELLFCTNKEVLKSRKTPNKLLKELERESNDPCEQL